MKHKEMNKDVHTAQLQLSTNDKMRGLTEIYTNIPILMWQADVLYWCVQYTVNCINQVFMVGMMMGSLMGYDMDTP